MFCQYEFTPNKEEYGLFRKCVYLEHAIIFWCCEHESN